MAIPIYDNTLPCMSFPFENVHIRSKRYLGNTALTGKVRATTTVICENDAEMNALHNFWMVDCNYGLEHFVLTAPIFGYPANGLSLLTQFIGDFKPIKAMDGIWNIKLNLRIVAPITFVKDDNGNYITDDNGDYVFADNTLPDTADNIISYVTLADIVI